MDVSFYGFLTLNLSLLEFKFLEEVMFVIFQGNRILSVAGETLVSFIEDYQSGGIFFIFTVVEDTLSLTTLLKCAASLKMLIKLISFLQKMYEIEDRYFLFFNH